MRFVLLASVLIWGCGSALPVPTTPQREVCYFRAESKADARWQAECGGVPLPQCAAHDSIMAELQAAQEVCP